MAETHPDGSGDSPDAGQEPKPNAGSGNDNHRTAVVIVVCVIIGFFIFLLVLYAIWRTKRRRPTSVPGIEIPPGLRPRLWEVHLTPPAVQLSGIELEKITPLSCIASNIRPSVDSPKNSAIPSTPIRNGKFHDTKALIQIAVIISMPYQTAPRGPKQQLVLWLGLAEIPLRF